MLAERVNQRPGAPQKHSAIPEVIARGDELRSSSRIGFLCETAYAEHLVIKSAPSFDVTVPGLRPRWRDAEHYDVFAGRCYLNATLQGFPIALLIRDDMI